MSALTITLIVIGSIVGYFIIGAITDVLFEKFDTETVMYAEEMKALWIIFWPLILPIPIIGFLIRYTSAVVRMPVDFISDRISRRNYRNNLEALRQDNQRLYQTVRELNAEILALKSARVRRYSVEEQKKASAVTVESKLDL